MQELDLTKSLIDGILEREGWPAYHDRGEDDRGGPTKGGITLRTLSEWREREVTVQELQALTEEEARYIYLRRYVYAPGFDAIEDDELRFQVVDAGVLHGTGWAARRLQELIGVSADGIIGPVTQGALRHYNPTRLGILFGCRRAKKLARLVRDDVRRRGLYRGDITNLVGWVDRALAFVEDEADSLVEPKETSIGQDDSL